MIIQTASKTVRRFVQAQEFPEITPRQAQLTKLDPFHPYLKARWEQGSHQAAQLLREIQAQGYSGGRTAVNDYLRTLRSGLALRLQSTRSTTDQTPGLRVPSARSAVWLLLRSDEELKPEQQHFAARLCQLSEKAHKGRELSREFFRLVRERRAEELDGWIASVQESSLPDLKRFASGLLSDKAAVTAGLSSEWSNGQTEGQVHRLKLIKRQMYGRANFDLLRARVLATA